MNHPRRILVVEDNEELAENMVEILEEEGFECRFAADAEAALALLAEQEYDGLITDFRLPSMTGVELLRRARGQSCNSPVVMVTGYADAKIVRDAEAAGALAVLSKPVDLPRLLGLVAQFGERGCEALIVEDSRELAEDLAEALDGAGCGPVVVATTVEQALSVRCLPRVAIVDVRLPDGSGIDVARTLRARDPSIQLLFVTGYGRELRGDIAAAMAGLSQAATPPSLLEKPVDFAGLVAIVSQGAERTGEP